MKRQRQMKCAGRRYLLFKRRSSPLLWTQRLSLHTDRVHLGPIRHLRVHRTAVARWHGSGKSQQSGIGADRASNKEGYYTTVYIVAESGDPCQRCGCTLYYRNSVGESICYRCPPRPQKYRSGMLTDEQWERLRALFPRMEAWNTISPFQVPESEYLY